jgi:peptidoglycan-N-acetylmuramic acid deacetylase
MKINNKKIAISAAIILIVTIFTYSTIKANMNSEEKYITVNANTSLSNKKIGWGIKREDNHEQPDLGSENKAIIEQYEGICMGNNEKKYIYLTFDEGYEAGYTQKILETLKQNNVKATFFITAHYLNTQEDLVKQMIQEGHIVGNHTPISLMSRSYKIIKC